MAQITSLIVGIVMVSLTAGVLINFMGGFVDNYDISGYNQSDIEVYNKLVEINNKTLDIKENVTSITDETSTISQLERFFSDAFSTLKLSLTSVGIVEDIAESGTDQSARLFGDSAPLFKTAIFTIITAVIIVGILLSSIVKREL